MPSINSVDMIIDMIRKDGCYPDDPQALEISQYKNDWGGKTFHIAYTTSEIFSRDSSPFCNDIEILWNRTKGVTEAGRKLLQSGWKVKDIKAE